MRLLDHWTFFTAVLPILSGLIVLHNFNSFIIQQLAILFTDIFFLIYEYTKDKQDYLMLKKRDNWANAQQIKAPAEEVKTRWKKMRKLHWSEPLKV